MSHHRHSAFAASIAAIWLLVWVAPARAQTPSVADAAVALLQEKCIACHGALQTSGLDVRQRETILKGGSRGPAIQPGKPDESLLFLAAAHQGELKMPPGSKSPLPADELDTLKKWIEQGANWPAPSAGEAAVALLQTKCAACHGASSMGGLDVRQRETILKGGSRGPAIQPGKPEESLLYQAAAHQGDLKMPPGSKSPLPAEELDVLKNWIRQGAAWPTAPSASARSAPTWWSFKPLRRPPVPQVKNATWVANPIDAFILEKLEQKGLQPAPPADKLTLVRRVYFDLIGLPPTPEQIDRFLKDSAPDAYERLIDELLASPRYGERWARDWLDVVRYADSAGYEGDVYYPNAWRYRDYVIKSFNDDKPYDRFVQEQIAGDELWPDDLNGKGLNSVGPDKLEHLEARVGTTLYTFGPEIQESNLDLTKLRSERLTDAVDTTASAFLGVTMGCSRCHDHKFDPFRQKDYYALQAVFAASEPERIPVVNGNAASHRDELSERGWRQSASLG